MEAKIEIPSFLSELLNKSEFKLAIETFASQVGDVLALKCTPFFPNYTDHGISHVSYVLKAMADLIPQEVKIKVTPALTPACCVIPMRLC